MSTIKQKLISALTIRAKYADYLDELIKDVESDCFSDKEMEDILVKLDFDFEREAA